VPSLARLDPARAAWRSSQDEQLGSGITDAALEYMIGLGVDVSDPDGDIVAG